MSLSDIEKRDRLRLIRSDNVGPITYRQLVKRFGSATEALAALPDLAAKGGRKRKIKLFPIDAAEREITNTHEAGAQFLFLETNNYPSQLAALPDAPPVLIIKGNLDFHLSGIFFQSNCRLDDQRFFGTTTLLFAFVATDRQH